MSSYADNCSALRHEQRQNPSPPQKKSYTLGGQSKVQKRKRGRPTKQRGDDFYAAAEAHAAKRARGSHGQAAEPLLRPPSTARPRTRMLLPV